jgi:formylglycine-generating enzyme required for sulfatase activity
LRHGQTRQIVDLSRQPAELIEPFEYEGKLHRVAFSAAALASIKARLAGLGIAPGSFAWEPRKRPDGKDAGPYPGLSAFEEDDAAIFFGREADIVAGLVKLRLMRRRRLLRLFVIQAASGAGKSSFLKAGLWPRLKRDPDFAPLCILRPAQGILTGPDGIGQRIAPWFERRRRAKVTGNIEASLTQPDRAAAVSALAALLAEATALATTARRAGVVDARPPAPLLAVDQGEELFASENVAESERFLELLAAVFNDLPEDVDPYVLVTIRADSVEPLLQRWPALGLAPPETQMLPPLSPTAYRDVITKPAEVYTARVRRLVVEPALADKLALDARGGDALPLLAFTLEKLFEKFGADGNLTLARYEGMKGIGGSIDSALGEALRQAGAVRTADDLRRLVVPGLATWDPEANAAKRLVAAEAEFLGAKRSELAPLANALVANRLLTRGAGTLEVAHEALLRRPPIDGWLAEQKDSLKLRDDVLREAKEWGAGGKHHDDLVRRGVRLESALDLVAKPDFAAALAPASEYLGASRRLEAAGRRRARLGLALIYLMFLLVGGVTAGMYERELFVFWLQYARMWPYLTTVDAALAKKRGEPFWDCARSGDNYSQLCPGMVVVAAGSFMMGSPDTEKDRDKNEGPQRKVTIAAPFAVSRHEVTFDQWDACAAAGGCRTVSSDSGWGRGRRPVINVSWDDAQDYVAWLAAMTGHRYRLLTEAQWEYAARGGRQTRWSFHDDEAQLKDHAWYGINSQDKTQEVGQKKPNDFGLFDMHGNVWEWVRDCYVEYDKSSRDGSSAPDSENCPRVLRGGAWDDKNPKDLRSAQRFGYPPGFRYITFGFRVARSLSPART